MGSAVATSVLHRRAANCVLLDDPSQPSGKPASASDALEAANAKLEELNAVDKAPSSWADLGLPQSTVPEPEIPAFLNIAPAVLGVLSVTSLLLNNAGVFGEGPDLDEFAKNLEDSVAALEQVR